MTTKVRPFLYINLKIWPVPIVTSWNFLKNKAVLLKWFKTLDCPYYHELKLSQIKYSSLWYHLKIWTAPIITSRNFCRNTPDLMKLREYLNCPYTTRENVWKNKAVLWNMNWKFDLPLLSWAEIFVKIRQFSRSDFKNWIVSIITD